METCYKRGSVSPGRGKRFLSFCRDTLVGNPGDPLIGFPIVLTTENSQLRTEN
jgi:hypothetical protein